MFSNELVKDLIETPKKLVGVNATINLMNPKSRFLLESTDSEYSDYKFLFQVENSKKVSLRVSIHSQENTTMEGLIRIDYRGGHKNPSNINEFVPEYLKQYVGIHFFDTSHIHVYVEGFSMLQWAMPLTNSDFQIKEVENNEDLQKAIDFFIRRINITSRIDIAGTVL